MTNIRCILGEFLSQSCTEFELCEMLNMSPTALLDIVNSPEFQAELAALDTLRKARAPFLEEDHRTAARSFLAGLSSSRNPETVRRAATSLLNDLRAAAKAQAATTKKSRPQTTTVEGERVKHTESPNSNSTGNAPVQFDRDLGSAGSRELTTETVDSTAAPRHRVRGARAGPRESSCVTEVSVAKNYGCVKWRPAGGVGRVSSLHNQDPKMLNSLPVRRALLRPEALYILALLGAGTTAAVAVSTSKMAGPLPPVVFPAENPLSEPKRVLGKILFWDEQLSSDGTMACGTCHIMGSGGTDPTLALHPGNDGIAGTPDDLRTSFGVIAADENEDYAPDAVFGFDRQRTSRATNTAVMAMYAPELFWDGRATNEFTDPDSGVVTIATGAALESQVLAPPLSSVEMGHADRDWDHVASKLVTASPLALATEWPNDVQLAIDSFSTYPQLFEQAFGDGEITPARIAMAIATYERTLVPDQTPWDMFMMGDNQAMTNRQIQGWNVFQGSRCVVCHAPPLFTDHSFRNVALRPNGEDIGREEVTGLAADRGKFKTPTLRNVGLKASMMHTGQFTTVQQVFPFYAGPGAPGNPNRDALLPAPIAPPQQAAVADFIENALTDPRVANEEFPFDRPTLYTERTAEHSQVVASGIAGSGGVPAIVLNSPAYLGNEWFKVGVHGVNAGSVVRLAIADQPPAGQVLSADTVVGPMTVGGIGAGGFVTAHWPVPSDGALDGVERYFQWMVEDSSAPGGVARSAVVRATLFCGSRECAPLCPGDIADDFGVLGGDGAVSFGDFLALLGLVGPCPGGAASCPGDIADDFGVLGSDGAVSFGDFLALLGLVGDCA